MRTTGRSRRRLAGLASLIGATCLLGGSASALAAAKRPPSVGTATAATGVVGLSGPGITPHRLAVGERLPLGARLTVHARARLTLRLARPASVPATRDLVVIGPSAGVRLKVTAYRRGRFTIVRIAPARASSPRSVREERVRTSAGPAEPPVT